MGNHNGSDCASVAKSNQGERRFSLIEMPGIKIASVMTGISDEAFERVIGNALDSLDLRRLLAACEKAKRLGDGDGGDWDGDGDWDEGDDWDEEGLDDAEGDDDAEGYEEAGDGDDSEDYGDDDA
ncbi:MAG: hypothetical protein LBU69_02375, partial [Deltaproteobacteria bacterium]|nr:hypothetical protein [Deltaproteobacteria bacterium]